MALRSEQRVMAGFLLGLIVVATISLISLYRVNQFKSDTEWVTHTEVVLSRLATLMSSITDAETGQRGYSLTGNKSYLEPYFSAKDRVDREYAELRGLTSDNPVQQKYLDELKPILDQRMAVLGESIEIRRTQGYAAAVQHELSTGTGTGKQLHDHIRRIVADMVKLEDNLLRQRERSSDRAAQAGVASIILATLAGTGIILWAMLVVRHNLAKLHEAEKNLRIAAATFESQAGIIVTDANTVIQRINKAYTESTGYLTEDIIGQKPSIVQSGRHDAAFYAAMWESIHLTGSWKGEIWNRHKNGEIHPKWMTISAVKSDDGAVSNYVGVETDITERKQIEDRVRQLAFYDPLTKLPNRRLLFDRLAQTMAQSKRNGCYGAVMFLDLDNFKPVNDMHGHEAGDLLLIEVADRLKSSVREMDTVGRFGGDEFVVLLSELNANHDTSIKQAYIVAEKISKALSEPYRLIVRHERKADITVEHRCTTSIGVVLFIDHEATQEDILKWADTAMYQAKEAGRNTVRVYGSTV